MRIRLIRRWQYRREGQVIDPGDGVANYLISRRFAVPVDADTTAPAAELSIERRQKRQRTATHY